jgi:hypothetical protein
VGESRSRVIDHVVHAVADLEEAARAYEGLGFTVTPVADHPFGTSNRLVVLEEGYVEIVAVTRPEHLPVSGFAARVAQHLLHHGPGITHIVLDSADPKGDLHQLGDLATGDIFSFSRPAPQVDGPDLTASFQCVLLHNPPDLGLFLCHHLAREAVWNPAALRHANGASAITEVGVPVAESSLRLLSAAAGVEPAASLTLGDISVHRGPALLRFDVELPATRVAGVTLGG